MDACRADAHSGRSRPHIAERRSDARIAIHAMMALATGKPAPEREGVFEVVAEEAL